MAVLEIGLVTPQMDDSRPRFIKWPSEMRIPVAGDFWQEAGEEEYVVQDVQWRYQAARPLEAIRVTPILYIAEPEEDCDCDGGCE